MNSIVKKIRRFVRQRILNRYELKALRRVKWWLQDQWARLKHLYYVLWDKCLVASCRRDFPTIRGKEETLKYLVENRCSISRYGDGELGLIFGKGIGFQPYDKELAHRLREILRTNDSDQMMVGLSEWIFYSDYGHYAEYRVQNLRRILDLLLPGKAYCSADISRFYRSTPDGHEALNQIRLLKQIWDGRDVTIIEGEKSRMGIGNDLFDNAGRIHRILCPAVNAYSHYQQIYQTALENIPRDELVLLALGPTATVLACDLFRAGYQAVDIGHADISYEWFLRNVTDPDGRVAIAGKYVNEVPNGNQVEDIDDADYAGQIVATVGIEQA